MDTSNDVDDVNNYHLPSDFGAGGLRVAQFVRMLRLPSHWPFIAPIALSASCEIQKNFLNRLCHYEKREREN